MRAIGEMGAAYRCSKIMLQLVKVDLRYHGGGSSKNMHLAARRHCSMSWRVAGPSERA